MELSDVVNFWNFLLLMLTAVSVLYLYSHQKFRYWQSQGVSYVKPHFFVGNMLDILFEETHITEVDRYSKLGRLYGSYEGLAPVLNIAEPELIKLILVKDFPAFTDRRHIKTGEEITDNLLTLLRGEEWKRVRTIITPSFTSGRMRKMEHHVNESAAMLVENLLASAGSKTAVDCRKYYGNFTMDVIARCAFGTKIDSQKDENNPFVLNAKKLLHRDNSVALLLLVIFPWLAKVFGPLIVVQGATNFFVNVSKQIIRKRKETGERGNDFLQLVMDAREGNLAKTDEGKEAESHHDVGNDSIALDSQSIRSKGLSEVEAIAQCFLFFLVGYDTTALTLSFISYCLALNQECQDKLIKEVDDVWEQNKGKVDFDIVTKMPYLDAVLCETLRLHTVAVRTERVAVDDYVLGDTGIKIPKGMLVSIPIYAIHRDPEWYLEPEKFDPERFSLENREQRDPYTYLPFGAGPRNCIGMRFALMEAKLCLVNVLRHVRFTKSAETKIPLEFYKGQLVLQPKSIILQVERRIRHQE